MNITLEKATPNLAEWWYESRQELETVKFNPLAPSTVESLRERILKASFDLSDYDKAESFFWVLKSDDEIVGHISMQNINKMMCTAEIGYGVSAHVRGKGIGTFGVQSLSKNVFDKTPIRKLTAFVHENNLSSRKLLEKVGFKQEGFLREHYLVNGKVANEIIYGLLRSDIKH